MSKWNLVRLSEVLNYEQPTKYIVETTNYNDKHKTPVLTAGKTFLLGHTNEKTGIFPKEKLPIIIFDDFTTVSKLVDFQFKVKSSAMKMLHPKNKDVDIKYVFYAIKNIPFSPEEHKRFWISKYSKFRIPLPPLPEQQKIASFLTRIEALIQKREESIQLLDELIKSTFLDMFGDPVLNPKGWSVNILDQFGDIITGNTPPRANEENYSSNYIEWIKTDNIVEGELFPTKAKEYLSEVGLNRGRSVQEGAIIVACIAGSIKSIGGISLINRTVAFNQQINAIQPYVDVNSKFLYYLLNNSKSYIQHQAGKGMKKIITKSVFKNISFPLPPKPLQDKFASIVTKIEATKEKYQTSLEELNNLFNSTAQKAFKGELNLGKITIIEKAISKEEAQMLDEDRILELIKSGSFEAKDHVNEQQSYDDIRDKVLKLMDEGKITQIFTADKKNEGNMVLEAVN